LCRYCRRDFKPTDNIISNGKHRKYYHEACAIVLSIINPHHNEIAVDDFQDYKNSELSTHIRSQSPYQPVVIEPNHSTYQTI
jgi:hypothetical protein